MKIDNYIYLGYKEGKHWCKEVNPVPLIDWSKYKDDGINMNTKAEKYEKHFQRWQAAESQLKEYEIENEGENSDSGEEAWFDTSKTEFVLLSINQQFTGEQVNNKVRIV